MLLSINTTTPVLSLIIGVRRISRTLPLNIKKSSSTSSIPEHNYEQSYAMNY